MRSRRVDGPQCCSLVESSLNLTTLTEACLVASGDENPPLFWLCACWLDARSDGALPVVEGQDLESLAAGFGSNSFRCVRLVGVWDIGGDLIEPVLSLSFGLFERGILLRSSRKERKCQDGSCREAHTAGRAWFVLGGEEEEERRCRLQELRATSKVWYDVSASDKHDSAYCAKKERVERREA